jgi:hypothetical protein
MVGYMAKNSDYSDNLGKEIDRIFNETNDLDEMQSKVVALVKLHAEKTLSQTPGDHKDELAAIEAEMQGYYREKMPNKERNQDSLSKGEQNKEGKFGGISKESRENFKKLLKGFAIYEAYKVMNPKRIAGETEATNYQHNLKVRDEKTAERYVHGLTEHQKDELREQVNKPKDRTLSALDLATSLRGSLENPKSRERVEDLRAKWHEAQLRKQAEAARNNNGPGKGQGGPGL